MQKQDLNFTVFLTILIRINSACKYTLQNQKIIIFQSHSLNTRL